MLEHDLYKPWVAGEKDWGVEILDGEFSGTVIQIESVEFKDDESGNLQIEYNVLNKDANELNSNPLFVSTFELIINDILKVAVEDYERNRNSSSEKSST